MRITVKQLRELFRQGLDEAAISAHPDYLKKEKVREKLQELVNMAVASGEVKDQQSLDDFFATIDMAAKALKAVPIDVYKKMTGAVPKG